jgi:uncharacterized protein YqgC (DUF456 family)
MDPLITLLVATVMIVGLIGTLLPWVPDTLMIWGAGLAYGLLVGWGTWGGWLFALITLLAVAALAAEVALSAGGARAAGASGCGIGVGLVAATAGLILFSPVGAFVGLLAGLLAYEWIRWRDTRRAAQATGGALLGWGLSFLVKFVLGALMIALWGVWVVSA